MKQSYEEFSKAINDNNLYIVRCSYDEEFLENQDKQTGFRPIHIACWKNSLKMVKFFLEQGCEVNSYDKGGYRPIHIASWCGNLEIIKLLIDYHCELNCFTKEDKSPMDLAVERNHNNCIEFLKNAISHQQTLKTDGENSILLNEDDRSTINCDPCCDHTKCLKTLSLTSYKTGKKIGSGSFGKVYSVFTPQNPPFKFVVKKISLIKLFGKNNLESDINKYRKSIIHERIVLYYGALEDKSHIFIFMEYMSGGSLHDKISKNGSLSYTEIAHHSKQILEGLAFLHENKIIHRDIKAANILLDNKGNAKLSDFGFSRFLKNRNTNIGSTSIENHSNYTAAETFCGTANYLAPEIIEGKPYKYSADIWSFGATFIEMLTGKPPFPDTESVAIIFSIGNNKKLEYELSEILPANIQHFLDQMLVPEVDNRATAEGLLNHNFIKTT